MSVLYSGKYNVGGRCGADSDVGLQSWPWPMGMGWRTGFA